MYFQETRPSSSKWCWSDSIYRKRSENILEMCAGSTPGPSLLAPRPPTHPFLFPSTSLRRAMLAGCGPLGGAVNMCIICLWARLVRSWYQLGATWTQLGSNLGPTWTEFGTNSSQHVKINTKVTPKWSKSEYRATCSHQKIIKIHKENVYFQETSPS